MAERHSELQNRPRTRYRTSRTFGVLNNLKLCLEHDLKMANHVRCGRCRFVSRSLVLSTIRRSAKCSSIRLYFGAHHPSEPTLHCECNSGPIILRIFIFFFTTLGHFSVLLCCAALLFYSFLEEFHLSVYFIGFLDKFHLSVKCDQDQIKSGF